MTPPPTYPSPPQYSTEGAATPVSGSNGGIITSTPMAEQLQNSIGEQVHLEEVGVGVADLERMAPAYTDDVSFVQGVRRSGHVICLLFTIMLYSLLVLFLTGWCQWLNDETHYSRILIFAM